MADYWDPLPADARTVAHALRDRGYATAWFGKWHLARRDRQAPFVGDIHAKMIVPPENRGGFEFWEGFEGGFLLMIRGCTGRDCPNRNTSRVIRRMCWPKGPRLGLRNAERGVRIRPNPTLRL